MLYKRRRERNREEEGKKNHRNYIKKTIGTKLITYTKKVKLKNYSRVWKFKNTMLKKRRRKKKKTRSKNYKKYIYMKFAEEEKNRVFFFFFSK